MSDESNEHDVTGKHCQTCRNYNTTYCYVSFCELDGFQKEPGDSCDKWQATDTTTESKGDVDERLK